jgi:hypothetical protein
LFTSIRLFEKQDLVGPDEYLSVMAILEYSSNSGGWLFLSDFHSGGDGIMKHEKKSEDSVADPALFKSLATSQPKSSAAVRSHLPVPERNGDHSDANGRFRWKSFSWLSTGRSKSRLGAPQPAGLREA